MRLLIVVENNESISMYAGPQTKNKQAKLDEKAAFLELKLYTNNPRAKENLELWKKFVAEKKYYGLLVTVNNDENSYEYIPLPTLNDYNGFLDLFKKKE